MIKRDIFAVMALLSKHRRLFNIGLFVLLLACAVWTLTSAKQPMVYTSVSRDRSVLVNASPDAHRIAKFIERLRRRTRAFIERSLELYPHDTRLQRINDKWSGEFGETDPASKTIAYSVSKSDIRVCVKNRRGELADINAAMFVILHELAHIATDEVGHTETYWKNFRFILEIAERVGVYRYQDHEKVETTVCDKQLGANPMSCVKRGHCDSTLDGR